MRHLIPIILILGVSATGTSLGVFAAYYLYMSVNPQDDGLGAGITALVLGAPAGTAVGFIFAIRRFRRHQTDPEARGSTIVIAVAVILLVILIIASIA